MSRPPIPRDRLGEVGYRGLWWAAAGLPLLVALIRVATVPPAGTFFLFTVVGIPAIVATQVIAGLLAWTFRRRQWRHFLGPVAAVLSFVYYGLWVLLAVTLPETSGAVETASLLGRWFGDRAADAFGAVLLVLAPSTYVAMVVAIVVEGTRAVRRWRSESA